jgi:hypothetical protein
LSSQLKTAKGKQHLEYGLIDVFNTIDTDIIEEGSESGVTNVFYSPKIKSKKVVHTSEEEEVE